MSDAAQDFANRIVSGEVPVSVLRMGGLVTACRRSPDCACCLDLLFGDPSRPHVALGYRFHSAKDVDTLLKLIGSVRMDMWPDTPVGDPRVGTIVTERGE